MTESNFVSSDPDNENDRISYYRYGKSTQERRLDSSTDNKEKEYENNHEIEKTAEALYMTLGDPDNLENRVETYNNCVKNAKKICGKNNEKRK